MDVDVRTEQDVDLERTRLLGYGTPALADQFGIAEYEVKYGISLCNPVEKEGTPIQNPGLHLMCFEVKEKDVEVDTYNQFGPERLALDMPEVKRELCVPSSKIAPVP